MKLSQILDFGNFERVQSSINRIPAVKLSQILDFGNFERVKSSINGIPAVKLSQVPGFCVFEIVKPSVNRIPAVKLSQIPGFCNFERVWVRPLNYPRNYYDHSSTISHFEKRKANLAKLLKRKKKIKKATYAERLMLDSL